MSDVMFQEFRDELQTANYPFADVASLTTTDGLSLPQRLVLDASIFPAGLVVGARVASITVADIGTTITIGDSVSSNRATGFFAVNTTPSILKLIDSYSRAAGVLVLDPLQVAAIAGWPLGTHVFQIGSANFVGTCCIAPPAPAVEALTADGNGFLTNEVWIVGKNGVVVREVNGEVRVDVVGSPLFVRQLCQPVGQFVTPRFVRTINGQIPDIHGNFNLTTGNSLTPDTIVRIYPNGSGLQIEAAGPLIQG